ncbi:hypothetical protein [Endozoicomonas numazuensis]|uniref:hypothetical protein n=1 Tax=Endozoicomonas numazuensis TaxID=1137799 RepID=UPI00068EAB42|nr:hypothetical protein [Endozoicomonas numazuensis]
MEIKKQALFEVIELLQKNIDENLPEVINVEIEDFYWEISEEDLYNPVSTPEELTLGQLSEDWSELSRLMDDSNFPISYDLRRLSAILLILRKYSIGVW